MKNLKMTVLIPAFMMLVSLPSMVDAAELYFDPVSINAGVGSDVQVKVMLDTGGDKINAIGSTIKYPDKLLKLKNWSDGNSVISFWVQPIKIDSGFVSVQGMIPGGYQGMKGLLLTLDFEVIREGTGNLSFAGISEALLNDGRGTAALLKLGSLNVNVKGLESKTVDKIGDVLPPEDFVPVISRDINLFDNKYFVVFATQDKGSGVDHYEISEIKGLFRPLPANWITVQSPSVLQDQELRSWIFIRAVDRDGNERMEILKPTNIPVYQQPTFIIFLVLLVLGLLYGKKKKLYK